MYKWKFYTSKEIEPRGWVRRQLEIQAEGLSGHLDQVWRDVRDSAWIGGDAEGWERVPYWLDGFIPLAYLLKDEDLIARAKKYIDAILSKQAPSGWICPCREEEIPTYDTWAVQLISKALVVYYECSGDERIPAAVYRIMKNYYDLLASGTIRLFDWGKHRWYESFVALNFLHERYPDAWIAELAKILKTQGADYASMTDLWKTPFNEWTWERHIVNIGMMLKYEAISCDLLGEEYTDVAERLVTVLREYNGTPVGLFTGDECLSGLSPIQGTELCGVAEHSLPFKAPSYAVSRNKCIPMNGSFRARERANGQSAWKCSPSTHSPLPSVMTCGHISTTSSAIRLPAKNSPQDRFSEPTARKRICSALSQTSAAVPRTLTKHGPSLPYLPLCIKEIPYSPPCRFPPR